MRDVFLNEYESKFRPDPIHGVQVRFPKADTEKTTLDYRVTATLAHVLGRAENGVPVAPLGGSAIVSDRPLRLEKSTVTLQIEGRIVELEVSPSDAFELHPGAPGYADALRMLTNRRIDFALAGLFKDGRFYYQRNGQQHRQYQFRPGAYVAAKARSAGTTIVIDPSTSFSSTLNLFEMLQQELQGLKVASWRDLTPDQRAKINKKFRSRAYNLRTDYTEITRWGDEESKSYRFLEFDFDRAITDAMDGKPESPFQWHSKLGRGEMMGNPDQPVVLVRAKGGYTPLQVPSLLRVAPNMKALRISGLSDVAQNISQKESSDRVGEMITYAQRLATAGIIDDAGRPVEAESVSVAPIRWTLDKDYLDISKAKDFQRFFSKAKLLRPPTVARFWVLHAATAKEETDAALRVLARIAKRFGVPWPDPVVLPLPTGTPARLETLIGLAEKNNVGLDDLVLLITEETEEDDEELSFHDQVKRYSLTERVFPTQFINVESIQRCLKGASDKQRDEALSSQLLNLAFEQIVAKCGGVPHGLASGFAARGTIFIGVDRYRDPFEYRASASAAVSVFDEHGSHIASNACLFDSDKSDHIHQLAHLLDTTLRKVSKTHHIQKVVLLRDGTPQRDEQHEHDGLRSVATKYGASYLFVEAPKGTHTRLYGGEPDDTGMFVEKAPPFTVVTSLPDRPEDFVVLATDPWRGTPRPMLYRIATISDQLNLEEEKQGLARAIAWLCSHSWVAPTATRLPVPLDYADKMAELVGRIGAPLRADIDRPLYL